MADLATAGPHPIFTSADLAGKHLCPILQSLDSVLRLLGSAIRATTMVALSDGEGALIRVLVPPGTPIWRSVSHREGFVDRLLSSPIDVLDLEQPVLLTHSDAGEDIRVRSLLSVPLTSEDGSAFGALIAADTGTRTWTEGERGLLAEAGSLVMETLRKSDAESMFTRKSRPAGGSDACAEGSGGGNGGECPLLRGLPSELGGQMRREAHRYLDQLLANLPVIAWESVGPGNARDQKLVYLSSSWERLLGYRREDWLGRQHNVIATIIHPEDRRRAAAEVNAMFATGRGVRSVHRCLAADGQIVWVEANMEVLLDAQGKPVGLRGLAVDISDRKRAEAALRESEESYRNIVDTAQEGVCILDAHDNIRYANQRFAELLSYAREEMYGRSIYDFLDPNARYNAERNLGRRRQGISEVLDFCFQRKDGSLLWTIISSSPTFNANGEYTGALGMFTDITDRKRIEERQLLLAHAGAILSSSLDNDVTLQSVTRLAVPTLADYCVVDLLSEDGKLRRVGEAHRDPEKEETLREFCRRYPISLDAPAGVALVVRTGRPELNTEFHDAWLVATARDEDHLCLLRTLGLTSALSVPLKARGRVLGALTLFTSESGRHYSEEDIPVAEDLARLCALAIDNAHLYAEVQEMNRAKDEFLAMLGHELRNPLSAIANAIRVMKPLQRAGIGAGSAGDLEGIGAEMELQVRHMTRLMDDLLDVARITRGQIPLRCEPVSLRTAVTSAARSLRPMLQHRNQPLEITLPDEDVVLNADPLRLNQILCNLLHNASKYTPDGGRIALTASLAGDFLKLDISDSGIGIPPEMLPKVFQLFTQGDRPLDRPGGGLGIGLTLVKSLVELHGGCIEASSPGPDQGSTFTVHLPVGADGEAQACKAVDAPSACPPVAAPEKSILLVDDNAFSARMMANVLRRAGHAVCIAGDGTEALDAARAERPDLVLLDIGLPGMDGYEVARCMRAEPALAGVTLAALTGYGRAEDRERALASGFDHHLVKPVDFDALLRFIDDLPKRA